MAEGDEESWVRWRRSRKSEGECCRKRSYENIERWMDNEISFPSVRRYRLVDSPTVLEAYIEGFQKDDDEFGSNGFHDPLDDQVPNCQRNSHHEEASKESKPPENVLISDGYLDQPITIRGNFSMECWLELINILHKHIDVFAWTPTNMIGMPHFITEHQLKTYPHIEPRVPSKSAEMAIICMDTLKKCTSKKDFCRTKALEEAFQTMKRLIAELLMLTTLMKGKELMVLADFIADKVTKVNPARGEAFDKEETLEPSKVRDTSVVPDLETRPEAWKLYTEAASNDNGSGAGLILIDAEGADYSYYLLLNFNNSHNDAKYEALSARLRIAIEIKARCEKTMKYKEKVMEIVAYFDKFHINHIPREQNKKVDTLSKLAADQFNHLTNEVLMEVLGERSVDIAEVNMVMKKEARTWMTPIRDYIEKGILPDDPAEAKALKEKK
nr:hypothetical protein [Tanacetum cinerariifolium]